MRLAQNDMYALLAAIEQLNSDLSAETLRERTLAAVAALIPAEITAFDGFSNDGVHTNDYWSDSLLTGEQMEIFAAYAAEHPSFAATVIEKRTEALKITDFASDQNFRRTALYNEFYRLVGIDRQITVGLRAAPEHFYTCALSRCKKDFTERERQLLNLLAPHLINAFRNALKFHTAERMSAALQTALDEFSQGIIVVDEDGRLRFISGAAENFLNLYFKDDNSEAGFLPEELRRWAAHCRGLLSEANDFGLPPSFIAEYSQNKLRVDFSYDSRACEIVLLLEEKKNLSASALERLGLTKREAEILFLLTRGKTNVEIGTLCGISWRTAQKHVEHIFDKLGVETRTAAMIRAFEVLR